MAFKNGTRMTQDRSSDQEDQNRRILKCLLVLSGVHPRALIPRHPRSVFCLEAPMTYILVRKLLRDIRPALIVLCLLLFAFAALWVKVTQRVTTEITPFITTVTSFARLPPELFEKVIFRGPGKVSQAVLGGSDLRFDQANDFLAVGMLHPVVIILTSVWSIGRAAGSVSGELDRGTMELLMSQPVP